MDVGKTISGSGKHGAISCSVEHVTRPWGVLATCRNKTEPSNIRISTIIRTNLVPRSCGSASGNNVSGKRLRALVAA
jgi:hypothetical protein